MPQFYAQILKIGINPVVDPPENVLQVLFENAGRSKGPIRVRGLLNGTEFIQTLVKYQGEWRLYINGPMLKAAGIDVGETAHIEIEFDPRPREVPVPEKFEKALVKNPPANAAPYRQKEILRYLGSLKNEASLVRNIEKVLRQLTAEGPDAPHGPVVLDEDR